jgi:hypothetical protein
MITTTQTDAGWLVSGPCPPTVPPIGWNLLLAAIRAMLEQLSPPLPAPTTPPLSVRAAMPPSPISPTAPAKSVGNPDDSRS